MDLSCTVNFQDIGRYCPKTANSFLTTSILDTVRGGYSSNFETALWPNKPEWWDSQAERKCDDTFSHFDAHHG